MRELLFRWIARRLAIPLLRAARGSGLAQVIQLLGRLWPGGERPPHGAHPSTRRWAEVSGQMDCYRELLPEQTMIRPLPRTIDDQVHWIFRKMARQQTPAVFLAQLSGARVIGSAGHVIAPDNRVLGDVSREWFFAPEQNSLLFKFKVPTKQRLPGTTVPLAVISGGTYYHWLTDVLPRLAILEMAGKKISQIDHFVVNDSRAPFLRESLDILGIPPAKRLFTSRSLHWECERLLLPSHPGVPGLTPKWVVEFLREKLLPGAQPGPATSRVYVSRQRSKYRKFRNSQAVGEFLSGLGFVEIFLEELPFARQIGLFASAEVIVAPHGAGLTNLAFCRPGTKVLEIFSPNYVNECFWNLATWIDLDYVYLLGAGPRPPAQVDPHRVEEDIEVNLEQLKQSLKLLGI